MEDSPRKTIAFITGSGPDQGIEQLLENVKEERCVDNEFGRVLSIYTGNYKNVRVIILPRHGDGQGEPRRTPAELVKEKGFEANIWELHKRGVEEVYGFSAVGAIDTYTPLSDTGTFIVPYGCIRGFGAREHSFGTTPPKIHSNMSKPFDEGLTNNIVHAMTHAGCTARSEGIYIYNVGDCFETPDEIALLDKITRKPFFSQIFEKNFRRKKDRLVGMTAVPEIILLKQVEIPAAYICCNVNAAEGKSKNIVVSHEQTKKVMEQTKPYILKIARNIIVYSAHT